MKSIISFDEFQCLESIRESMNGFGMIAESLTNEVDKNLKFGIIVSTHKIVDHARANYMDTPTILRECLESIASQTYDNWKVFIVADCYEGDEEILEVIKDVLGKKYEYHNMSKPGERSQDITTHEKKITGGTTVWNKALVMAENAGMDIVAKLDHDDKWKNNHLMLLAKTYTQYPKAGFVYTRTAKKPTGGGTSKRILYYPGSKDISTVSENNQMAAGGKASHSAISWRLAPGLKGFRYRGVKEQKTTEPKRSYTWPVDLDIYPRIKDILKAKDYQYIYVPEVTCLYRNNKGEFPNR
jgi:glycosyltransferase involved in cell wall biosynthesis